MTIFRAGALLCGAFFVSFFMLFPGVASAGELLATAADAPPSVDLTAQGSADWAHWGFDGAANVVRKDGVSPQISDFVGIDGTKPTAKNRMASNYVWSDGSPLISGSTHSGLRAFNVGRGFGVSIAADTTMRSATLYVGAKEATGLFVATLSDGSAVPVSLDIQQGSEHSTRAITLMFMADSAGQTLDIEYRVIARTAAVGSFVSLEAATLIGELPDQAPIFDAIDDQVVIEGTTLSLPVMAKDIDGPGPLLLTQTNSLPQAPEILTVLSEGVGQINYVPDAGDAGDYSVTLTATSGNGVATNQTFGVSVLQAGSQPRLSASAEIAQRDVDLTLEGGADWVHWGRGGVTAVNRKAAVTPILGSYTTLTSGGLVAHNSVYSSYSWDDGATLSSASTQSGVRTSRAGQGFRLSVPADALTRTLKLYLGTKNGSGRLTLGLGNTSAQQEELILSRDSGKRTHVVTIEFSSPVSGQNLEVTWAVESFSGSGWISLEAAAIVGASSNAAPIIMVPNDQSVVEGQRLNFEVGATDTDGPAPLRLSATSSLPDNPDIYTDTAPGSGVIDWTAAIGDAVGSPYNITLTAVDGGGRSASAGVNVTVVPDTSGVNMAPVIASIASRSAVELSALLVAVSAVDTDGPLPLVLSQTSTVPDPENVVFIDDGNGAGQIAWTPPANSSGTYSFTVDAFDGDLTASTTFQVVVAPPGSGGLLVGTADVAAAEVDLTVIGETDWVHWGLDGVDDAVDRKTGVVAQIGDFSVLGGAEPTATRAGIVSRYLWSDGSPNAAASTRSGVRAFDEGRGFALSVPATNEVRRLKLYVGANTVTARLTASLSDGSAPPFTFDVVQPVGKSSRELTFDFAAPTAGATLDITYLVVDRPVSGWASLESAALVAGNAPPVIVAIDDVVVRPEMPVALQVTVSDPDGDIADLQVSATSDVPGEPAFTQTPDGQWLWQWTPQASEIGDFEVTFTAVDEFSGTATRVVGVRVTESEPPQLTSVGPQSLVEGQALSLALAATDIDGPAPLRFDQQTDLPTAAVLVDAGDGTADFSWLAQVGDAAGSPYTATITVTDGGGTASEISFPLAVAANQAPVLEVTPAGSTVLREGQTLAVMVEVSDPDATGPLSLTQTNDLPGAQATFTEVAAGIWEFLWVAGAGDASAAPRGLTITATDGLGGTTQTSLSITVLPNLAPMIGTTGPFTLRAGMAFERDLLISDPDGPGPLVITQSNTLPGSPAAVSPSGVFAWTPAAEDLAAGPFTLSVTATDGLLQSETTNYAINVVENLLPTISVTGDPAFEEWQTATLLVTVADADGVVTDVSATTTLPGGAVSVVDNFDGTYAISAALNSGASATPQSITVTATDNEGGVVTQVVDLMVTPRSRPNIVVILTDDQGLGDVAYSGFASELQTPALDELAAQGMRFNNFYANSSVCSPTRASLLTGRYPAKVGVPGTVARDPDTNMGQFTPNGATLPELLKSAGYATALVGKWHLGDRVVDVSNLPTARGFDEFRGFLGSALDYYTHDGSRFAWPGDDLIMINEDVVPPAEHVGIHTTDLLTPWAVDYIEQQTTNQTQPFFLEVAYTAPHDPVQPPPEYLAAVKAREPGLSDDRAQLVALLEHMDASIGEIVQTLKDVGVYDNTVIIYTSDNGGYTRFAANNGPYRGGKLDMYEGGIRVPAVVTWPGRIAAASQTDDIALTMDLMPTIAEIVDFTIPQEVDGRSVVPTLRGESPVYPARDLIFENRSTIKDSRWKMIYAVRRDNWKLVQDAPGGDFELYDLSVDPFETTDLASTEPTIFADLQAALAAHTAQTDLVPWQRELVFEEGTIASVDGDWQSVALSQPYRNPIVVATPIYDALQPPMVTRVRGVTTPGEASTAFDLRLQRADGSDATVLPVAVNYMVFEAGVYNEAHHGIKMEALPLDTRNRTNSSGFWGSPAQPIANTYDNPVVVGQVLSNADPDFSVFWSRGATRPSKPTSSYFAVGKHVGEDPDKKRNPEILGYLMFETGRARLGDKTLRAKVGALGVKGMGDLPPYVYDTGDEVITENVVLSSAGMKDSDGGWPVLVGPDPLANNQLALAIDEDTIADVERNHAPEQVAYVHFGNSRPEIEGLPGELTVVEGALVTLPFNYADLDDPMAVELSLSSDAPGDSLPVLTDGADGTGNIDWQLPMGSAGAYQLLLNASDGRGGERSVAVDVTVVAP